MYRSISKNWGIAVVVVCCIVLGSFKSRLITSGEVEINDYQEEEFSFAINEGKQTLTGTLAIPKEFNSSDKALILVTAPGASSRDYSGLYSNLSKELVRNGIAVLRYDPRHVADPTLPFQSVTMFDQADDAESAYNALKKDKRFGSLIGLLGHSEGGSAVAVVAARNNNIPFVVLLSSPGISGVELQLQNVCNKMEKMGEFVQLTQGKAPDTLENELLYSHLESIHTSIANNRNTDSIYNLLKEENKHFYDNYHKLHPKLFGTASMEERNKFDSLNFLTPHNMVLIQYEPELYFQKISCPVLAVFGKMDEIVFWEENSKGMESLFKKSKKDNYKILVLDSANHDYRKVTDSLSTILPPGITHHSQSSIDQHKDNFYVSAFSSIAKWVSEMK